MRHQTVFSFVSVAALGAVLLAVPIVIDDAFLINKWARYCCLAMLAVALSFSWGYAGILNLGQAVSFGVGAYAMAMHLKLKTTPIHTGADGLPDFMVWNNVERLPLFWVPFRSEAFALAAGVLLPVLLASLLGWFMFRGRVTGVYVAIITLATMVVINLLVIDQQAYTGGFNGITDLGYLVVFGHEFDPYALDVYFLAAGGLIAALLLGYLVVHSRAGLVLQAIRDSEDRVRFFGFDVARFKIGAFAFSAAVAGAAGMIYTVVMEFASPTFMDVPFSLAVVIWVAVGGRQSLLGAAIGALLVNGVQGALSETPLFLKSWSLVMGLLFIAVVLFLPQGLAGLIGQLSTRVRRAVAQSDRALATPVARSEA
jgi:urea transport system permease protein